MSFHLPLFHEFICTYAFISVTSHSLLLVNVLMTRFPSEANHCIGLCPIYRKPAQYNKTDVTLMDSATGKRQSSSSAMLIYIHHPANSESENPNSPLVPAAVCVSIVQASIATIQSITGLSVLNVGLYQSPAAVQNNGDARILIGVIVGSVLGGVLIIVLALILTILIIVIV